jgi:hypothetical protein
MKTCRICGKQLNLVPDPSCPQEWVDKIMSIPICCNRCGDFGWEISQVRGAIIKTCVSIGILKQSMNEDDEGKSSDKESAIRRRLSRLTKRLSQAWCKYTGKRYSEATTGGTWHPEIVSELWDHPDQCRTVLGVFERSTFGTTPINKPEANKP